MGDKLKYKILQADSLCNEDDLNKLALDGWELVDIVQTGVLYYFYFKRIVE